MVAIIVQKNVIQHNFELNPKGHGTKESSFFPLLSYENNNCFFNAYLILKYLC